MTVKDGDAGPWPGLCWRMDEHGAQYLAPIDLPRVEFTEHDEQLAAAVELERIAARYRDRLPAPSAVDASEILLAAHCLYAELYRDCGPSRRRQKLAGADLLRRFVDGVIEANQPKPGQRKRGDATSEERDRARAWIVLDLLDLGINGKAIRMDGRLTVFEVAAAVAKRKGWRLGDASSFRDAHYKWLNGSDWLASGLRSEEYQKIKLGDIEGLI